jgi:D-alanyl-D-alanine carboxypeptidase
MRDSVKWAVVKKSLTAGLGAALALVLFAPAAVAAQPHAPERARDAEVELPLETRRAIDAAIDQTILAGKAPGVVLGLWVPGQGSYVTAGGVSDTATNEPMRADMVMPIGSITKSYTATVVLQLVDEGQLTLDDTLDRWYPEIPEASAISVRMLLNMSSGVADYANTNISLFCSDPTRNWQPEELIALGVSTPRAFDPPGSAYNYSTTNTVLLGRIIEKVTDRSYEDNLRVRLFEPLGLHDTTLEATLPAPYAHGYSSCAEGPAPQDTSTWSRSWGWAGGGLYSTLADLHTFASAIGRGTTLSHDTFVARLTQLAPTDAAVHYGLGVNIASFPDGSIVFHTGQVFGYEALFAYFPGSGATLAFMVNGDGIATGGPDPTNILIEAVLPLILGGADS